MKTNHTDEEFDELRQRFETAYKTIGALLCPYLSEMVHFNADGLEHLKFGRRSHARSRDDQAIRMQLFPLASPIVQTSRTVQGMSATQGFEIFRSNGRTESRLAPRKFLEFVAILDNKRVRVVIKKVDGGPWYFWSIIPFWRIGRETGMRRMTYGNPDED